MTESDISGLGILLFYRSEIRTSDTMTNTSLIQKLKKGQKKAISPVIATIILIAVALVLALTVGVFAFGLFTSNAHTVSIKSGTLYASAASCSVATDDCLVLSVNNPGSATTGALTLTGPGTPAIAVPTGENFVQGVKTYNLNATGITSGDQYDLTISLSNGQSLTATMIAI